MEDGRKGWACTSTPINLDLGLYEYMYPILAESWFEVLAGLSSPAGFLAVFGNRQVFGGAPTKKVENPQIE